MKLDTWGWEWFDANLIVKINCECGQKIKAECDRATEGSFVVQCPTCKTHVTVVIDIGVKLE